MSFKASQEERTRLSQSTESTLGEESSFRFACHEDLPCFTQCCRDVNIYLTPYDVLRLRRALGMGSSEFLARHTRSFLAKSTSIPVVQLAMDPDTLYCRFVRDQGCTVYEDRPWACRMYPLDLAEGEGNYRFVAGSDRCLGLAEAKDWTVRGWLDNQGVGPYTAMEREFRHAMPARFVPGQDVGVGLGKVLFLAYDLDRFVEMLRDEKFRKLYDIDEELYRRVLENDEEMLRLAFQYIAAQLEELLGMA